MGDCYGVLYSGGDYEIVMEVDGEGFTFEGAKQWIVEDLTIRQQYWANLSEKTYFTGEVW